MHRLAIASTLLVSTLPAAAQTTLLQVPTESVGPAALGPDLDGDGARDLLVGDPGVQVGLWGANLGRPGRVRAHSGVDGTLLRTWDGEEVGDGYGIALAPLADVDGDRVPDLAIGAPRATAVAGHLPYVHVVAGAGGALLLRIEGPAQLSGYATALASPGDVDGDGVGDLAVGATGNAYALIGALEPDFAEVVSGADGAVLWRTPDTVPGYPVAVARHPDLDRDGAADVVVGLSGEDRVEIRSGATGAVLRTFAPPPGLGFGFGIGFGAAVAAGRDLDGDDVPDLAVGAPYELLTPPCIGCYEGTAAGGAVYVLSGADGAVVQRVTGGPGEIGLGTSLALIPDADLDGVDDLVTGSPTLRSGCCNYQPGSVRVHSARKPFPISTLGYGSYGLVRDAGDRDHDGAGDFLLGGRIVQTWPSTQFAAELIGSGLPPPVGTQSCAGGGGCLAFTYGTGAPSPAAGAFELHAWGWPAGTPGLLLLGAEPVFDPTGQAGPCIGGILARLPASPSGGGTPGSCTETLSRAIPGEILAQFPPGTTLYGQFTSPASGNAVHSDVIAFVVWP